MKRILLFGFATLLMAAGLAGCVKENVNAETGQTITIVGEKSDLIDEAGTKVYFEDGNSYWSTDAQESIGIFIDEQDIANVRLSGTSADGLSAEFSGSLGTTLASGEYTVYAYYPHGTIANGSQTSVDARVEIPSNQYPTFTSFDSKAAVMYSEPTPLQIDGTNAEGHSAKFNYAVAIANVIFANIADRVNNEPVTSFKITMPGTVTGRVELNLQSGEFGDWYSPTYMSNSVVVDFENAADFVFDGVNGIHIGIAPILVAAGSEVIVEAETENYTISKVISVPRDADFAAGTIKNLKINEPIVVEEKEVEVQLPSAVLDQAAIAALSNKSYTAAPYDITAADGSVWNASSTMKGNASGIHYLQIRPDEPGTITTPAISNAKSISMNVRASSTSSASITIYDSTGEIELASQPITSTSYQEVVFNISSEYSGKLQIISKNRTMYISSIDINPAERPTLTADPASISNVSSDGETGTINITSNGEDGWMAESLVDWIEIDDNTAMGLGDGSISYTIQANTGDARSDSEAIYITDGVLEAYVSVSQLGLNAGSDVWQLVTNYTDITAGEYVIVNEFSGKPYFANNADTGTGRITVSNTGIVVEGNQITSTVTDNMVWNFTASGDGFKVESKSAPGSYLGTIDDNNGVRVNNTMTSVWVFEATAGAVASKYDVAMKYNPGDGFRWMACYDANGLRAYTSTTTNQNGSLRIYKKM